jgi:nucleoside-diphosphate-sugar epimerase
MPPCFFIFGFGYTANFLAQKLIAQNIPVIGTTRKARNHPQVKLINFNEHEVARYLPSATHILISTPPNAEEGDPTVFRFAKLIQQQASQLQWMGYLSTTGVYGDHQGAWVDESSVSISPGASGQLRLNAENEWLSLAHKHQIPLHIFRLAGIYGLQRNALERILAGKQYSIYKEGHFFSRIHVEDIISIILASINNPNPYSIYNVADDEPTPAHLIDAYACKLLQRPSLPLMPYEIAKLSPMEQEFYTHNRRVANTKIKQELLINLNYSTYREGLTALLSSIKSF